MKYRILTNGKFFIVQRRSFLQWITETQLIGYNHSHNIQFSLEKEAASWCKKTYGKRAVRVRPYRVI